MKNALRWQQNYDLLKAYIAEHHQLPDKKKVENRGLLNWWKYNKKLLNAGELKPDRVELFNQLLELGERYKHVNQYQ